MLRRSIVASPSLAPGSATGTTAPTAKFHAPQTISDSPAGSPTSTVHTLILSASGWAAIPVTRPITTLSKSAVRGS